MVAASRNQNPIRRWLTVGPPGFAASVGQSRGRVPGVSSRLAGSGPMTPQPGRWSLVVPVKRLALAKTRLASVAGEHRFALALAFAIDTTAAALSSPEVAGVVVVTDEPVASRAAAAIGATVVPDRPDAGLNPA